MIPPRLTAINLGDHMEQKTSNPERVFISYASPDIDQAVEVEEHLRRHQIETFRDRSDVRKGANWDLEIEKQLQTSDRMVLLVSANSMPYRKEVHREWFFFDQKGKRIYPLLIDEKCNRHSRLYSYNHIDATRDFKGALDLLLTELRRDEYAAPERRTLADQVTVLENGEFEHRSLADALEAIYQAVTVRTTDVVLSKEQAMMVRDHIATDERGYRLRTIAEWSLPRYQIVNRFVNLTLLLDQGMEAPERWKPEDLRFSDLREVLTKTAEHPAIVLLGAPGSGKSTLLRRLQLDHSIDQLCADGPQYSFFVQLNSYQASRGQSLPLPGDWLAEKWKAECPHRPPLEECLQKGRVLLLLDALNEMPHRDTKDYFELIGLWRDFTRNAAQNGNRIVYSCRSLDYSARLSSKELPVPQVNIQAMTDDQVRAFLRAYLPANHAAIWAQLEKTPQLELYRNPYFLTLLVGQVVHTGQIPAGRSALFTAYVRETLSREIETGGEIFGLGQLFDEDDHERSTKKQWRGPFDLPNSGSPLFEKVSTLAFDMQRKGVESESAQIRISWDDAARLIDHDRAKEMITAALRMNILDRDKRQEEDLAFYHQLLQEYFAARRLARQPDAQLVHVEHEVDRVAEPLEKTVAGIAAGDPLPPLPQTGWEETTLTAAAMARDPVAFIRQLIPHNLPLAARCAKSGEIRESQELERLRDEIREKLFERTLSERVDLRARIAAGEALGIIGDPRFERRQGKYGDYLVPPLVEIPAGSYPIGDDRSGYNDEKPAHLVELTAYRIGVFPVTNAEYRCFIEAGGYEDERWWETEAARYWRREGGAVGQRQVVRYDREILNRNWTNESLDTLVEQGRLTPEQIEYYKKVRNLPVDEFERWLLDEYPSGKVYRQPQFWNDQRFNNPQQPVVGVTWFEARAYCSWLTATSGLEGEIYRLPTEVEFEAAARGPKGRAFPYGEKFDSARCNTFESHLRRTTPIGIFANATPEGSYDLSGNAFTWTSTIYDEERFRYPWRHDERENPEDAEARRLVRGGSWYDDQDDARAAYRYYGSPASRSDDGGFRVVCGLRPPSLKH
jgi:formylglycine-generating enzyme required for sulfatase activity